METLSALLGICEGNSLVNGEFPSQRPLTWSFDVFFYLRLNKRLSKQSRCWWFGMPLCSLWCHCNVSLCQLLLLPIGMHTCICELIHYWFRWSGGRHQRETFSTLLALCEGNSLVTGEFPSQRPVTWSFDVSFDLHLNKWLIKQSRCQWFGTPLVSLWRHCNEFVICLVLNPKLRQCRFNSISTFKENYNAFEVSLGGVAAIMVWWKINPLRAKLFRGNINIYLRFMSFLHIDMTQILKILHQVRQRPSYST